MTGLAPSDQVSPLTPRLTIAQVMAWTAVTAVSLTMRRAFSPEGTNSRDLFFVLLQSPAVAILLTWPFWRRRAYRFPLYGGDWLLVVIGAGAAFGMLELPLERWIYSQPLTGLASQNTAFSLWRGLLAVQIGIQAGCCALAAMKIPDIAWRVALALWAIPMFIFCAEIASEAFGGDAYQPSDHWLWKVTNILFSYHGVLLALPVVVVAGLDAVRRRSLPWTHWLGVGLFLATHSVNFIFHEVQALLR